MFYLHHTPWWLRMLFPKNVLWEGAVHTGNEVYLTFDDGPHPLATPFVLDELAKHNMKATFFCIGKNVAEYPHIYQRIIAEGHTVGNHTMHHVNGRNTSTENYLNNVIEASKIIQSDYFRPPYGQIKSRQAAAIRAAFPHMQLVMWSVIAGDFDERKTGEQCAVAVEKYTKPGSLIVYHDSQKAFDRLQNALPLTLQHLQQKGWQSVGL